MKLLYIVFTFLILSSCQNEFKQENQNDSKEYKIPKILNIVEYFKIIPVDFINIDLSEREFFLQPISNITVNKDGSEIVDLAKKQRKVIVDIKNGFLKIVEILYENINVIECAIFTKKDKSHLIGVSKRIYQADLSKSEFYFLEVSDNKIINVTEKYIPKFNYLDFIDNENTFINKGNTFVKNENPLVNKDEFDKYCKKSLNYLLYLPQFGTEIVFTIRNNRFINIYELPEDIKTRFNNFCGEDFFEINNLYNNLLHLHYKWDITKNSFVFVKHIPKNEEKLDL